MTKVGHGAKSREGRGREEHPALLHTVASLKASSGGTSRSVPALCEALGALRLNVALVAQSAQWPVSPDLIPDARLVRTRLVPGVSIPAVRLSYAPGFEREMKSICKRQHIDLVHMHGVWMYANHISARVAKDLDIPLVVSPRGMLEEWALAYRGWKKRLAWQLYQAADLRSARAFCATSHEEARQLRELGFNQPIAVIPNGVDVPQRMAPRPVKVGERTALFLSRIHPKKGLLDLVEAWAVIRPAGWQLVIAGQDEDGYTKVVKAAVAEAGLDGMVQFFGEVGGEEARRLWQEADLFVLPTYSENFGIVIAEALAWGIPVITTRGAPWSDLVDWKCGWWTNPGAEGLSAALASAVELSDAERQVMGERGRRLVQKKFDWSKIALDMKGFYGWLLGEGRKPDYVLAGP